MVNRAKFSLKFLFSYLQEIPDFFLSNDEMKQQLTEMGFTSVEILEVAEQIERFAKSASDRDINVSQNVGIASTLQGLANE